MSVYQITQINEHTKIGFWKINETLEELFSQFETCGSFKDVSEKIEYEDFKNESRKKEWLCTRLLLWQMFEVRSFIIKYNEFRAPFLEGVEFNISISHTKDLVAVLICRSRFVGIDVEILSKKIENLASKFLNAAENEALDLDRKNEHLYLHWCAKETLYKVHARKELDFLKHLYVEPFKVETNGAFTGRILTDSNIIYLNLNYSFFENYVVVWCAQ